MLVTGPMSNLLVRRSSGLAIRFIGVVGKYSEARDSTVLASRRRPGTE